mmetsp:Transcript_5140/g.8814  ORF Transcript_5140/g.8814 Transcript_5140/m.8814 type:complete len:214 (-) Transcript_5140:313-954(-)
MGGSITGDLINSNSPSPQNNDNNNDRRPPGHGDGLPDENIEGLTDEQANFVLPQTDGIEKTPASHLMDRERVCNDLMNTSVMAALIGGFALDSMEPPDEDPLDESIYLLAILSVHLSTCSALTSAFIYRKVNEMDDGECIKWVSKKSNQILLKAPLIKFVAGCMSYMIGIILRSYRDLSSYRATQVLAVCIGVSSVCSAWSIFFKVEASDRRK